MTATCYMPLVEVVEESTRLMELAAEWDELVGASCAPNSFLTWTWVSSWLETLGNRHQLLAVTARDPSDGRLIGVAPLAIETRRTPPLPTHRALVMIGSGTAAPDHLDLILRRGHEHAAEALWSAVMRRGGWDLIDLHGLRPGSHASGLILCSSLGRSLRQNPGRYGRKLDREAAARVVERLVSEPAEAESTVLDLAELHRQCRAAGSDTTAFHDDGMVEFHRRVAFRFAAEGKLRMHRLDVGGRAAAIIYCFRHGDVVSFYKTGYDPQLSRYGPGHRIMAVAIRSAIEEGAVEFDFLRGDEPYKNRWGAAIRYDQRLVVPCGGRGRLVHAAMRTGWAVRAACRRRGSCPERKHLHR